MAQAAEGYKHEAPFDSGFLPVGSIHKLRYEQYGNKEGTPVVFLHGGPGGSTSLKSTIYFNPAVFRVILFDQRGAGRSLPTGELRDNTVPDLVTDIEALRKHFGVQRWHVFGASWGSTLGLLYAQAFPEAVASLTVRGVFSELVDDHVNDYESIRQIQRAFYPEEYEQLVADLTDEERKDVSGSYAKRFSCGDHAAEVAAAKRYNRWGGNLDRLIPPEDSDQAVMTEDEERRMVGRCRLECYYHAHNLWLKELRFLEPDNVERIKDIPCNIVNGRFDLCLPPIMSWKLSQLLPKSRLFLIPAAGHSAAEPGIQAKLVEIYDELATHPM